jgi:hypothetical protein
MMSKELSYRQPLGVIDSAAREQSVEGVISWDDETNRVHEELGSDVEEDQEEVQGAEPEHDIDLGHVGVGLEVIENFVFPELRRDLLATRLNSSAAAELRSLLVESHPSNNKSRMSPGAPKRQSSAS